MSSKIAFLSKYFLFKYPAIKSHTSSNGKSIDIALSGPKLIERTATAIKANPPPEKPDLDIEKRKTQIEIIM